VEIIDLVYEAAFVPELWPKLLAGLAATSNSIGSTLFLFGDDGRASGVTLDNLRDLLSEFRISPDLRFSTSVVRMCDTKPNSFVEVDDYLSASEIANDPIRQRLRARGIGTHICTAAPMPTGELAIYVLQKGLGATRYDPEELARLNSLRPHLARAGLIASRLGFERANGTVAALEALGLAASVCVNGRAIATNTSFLQYPNLFSIGVGDHVSVAHGPANELLRAALHESKRGSALQAVRSIPITSSSKATPGVLHVLPLLRSASDIFSGGDTILVYTPAKPSALVPAPSLLSGLFDLTPAEAKLAASLSSGQTLKAAAEQSGIKFATARSYLEQIFRKTGSSQQSQLVALLKSATAIR
jgi:DNA-binding CsgD family transcriptional regulator